MAVRDPETGKFVSAEDASESTEYADFKWFGMRYILTSSNGTPLENVSDLRALDTGDAPPDDLASDEVAELVYMRLTPGLAIVDPDDDTTTPGSLEARMELGYNQSDASQTLAEAADNDVQNDGVVVGGTQIGTDQAGAVSLGDTSDDPGILWSRRMTAGDVVRDVTNGLGGGASQTFDLPAYEQHFRKDFGRGPVLDATDDLSITASLRARNIEATSVETYVTIQMAYDVAEVEGVRNQFSTPQL